MFLNEDIDTVPERHAFVGNYRRYCSSIIEAIVQKRPQEAIPHILLGVDSNLENLYSGIEPFNGECTMLSSEPLAAD
jgi:exportin-5